MEYFKRLLYKLSIIILWPFVILLAFTIITTIAIVTFFVLMAIWFYLPSMKVVRDRNGKLVLNEPE